MGTGHDLYPSTLLSSSAIFLYAIRNGTNIDVPILNNIAKRYATMIYIIHPFIIFIFRQLMPRNDIYSFGFFIILFAVISTEHGLSESYQTQNYQPASSLVKQDRR